MANNPGIVKRGVVYPASGPITMDVDIPVATVSGTVKVNGAAPTQSNDGLLVRPWTGTTRGRVQSDARGPRR